MNRLFQKLLAQCRVRNQRIRKISSEFTTILRAGSAFRTEVHDVPVVFPLQLRLFVDIYRQQQPLCDVTKGGGVGCSGTLHWPSSLGHEIRSKLRRKWSR